MCCFSWGREKQEYILKWLWYASNTAASASATYGQNYDLPEHLVPDEIWLLKMKANCCVLTIDKLEKLHPKRWVRDWSAGLMDFHSVYADALQNLRPATQVPKPCFRMTWFGRNSLFWISSFLLFLKSAQCLLPPQCTYPGDGVVLCSPSLLLPA